MNVFGWIFTNLLAIGFGVFLGWNFRVLLAG